MVKKKKSSNKASLRLAGEPARRAPSLHRFYKGKIEVMPSCPVRRLDDFSYWYTPGVAAPSKEIYSNPELVNEYTGRWNSVAIVTDGSRVLGLGRVGPRAALPVMEGKAMLFKYLGGVNAYPICVQTKTPDDLINITQALEPTFGGINLEDISQPACFRVLQQLRGKMNIPVWHDDQQGTATVIVAGFLNALEVCNKKIGHVKVAMVGAGAANIYTARLLMHAGVHGGNIIMCDSRGILNRNRTDIKATNPYKWEMCEKTNHEQRSGGGQEALEGTDVVIALSTPGPGVIKPEWIKRMSSRPVVFAAANPTPEIWPWEAKEAGAYIVATGRSDFPNQINNSLGFPAIFRGVLDVGASSISNDMCIAAAETLACWARNKGLKPDYIVPTMEEWRVYVEVAVAVGMQAIKEGIARRHLTREKLRRQAGRIIEDARAKLHTLMREGLVPLSPQMKTKHW